MEMEILDKANNEVVIGAYSAYDYKKYVIELNRYNDKSSYYSDRIRVLTNKKQWLKFVFDNYSENNYINACDSSRGLLIAKDCLSYVEYDISGNTLDVEVYGDKDFIKYHIDLVEQNFEVIQSCIQWTYNADGDNVTIPLTNEKMAIDEMYPFLNEPLLDYYDRFLSSNSSILLLHGPAGTGKTTFIRNLIIHAKTSANITYDPALLQKDNFFAEFIEDDQTNILVLEDSDLFLMKRSEGNDLMHKFLNIGDGLISNKSKKIIFSTNLESIRNIDGALVRPGRCFDIIDFKKLTHEQAVNLAGKLDIELPDEKQEEYTLAEVFYKKNTTLGDPFGFNQSQ